MKKTNDEDSLEFYFNTNDLQGLLNSKPSAVIINLKLAIATFNVDGKPTKINTAVITATPPEEEMSSRPNSVVYGCPYPPGCGTRGNCNEAEEQINFIKNLSETNRLT